MHSIAAVCHVALRCNAYVVKPPLDLRRPRTLRRRQRDRRVARRRRKHAVKHLDQSNVSDRWHRWIKSCNATTISTPHIGTQRSTLQRCAARCNTAQRVATAVLATVSGLRPSHRVAGAHGAELGLVVVHRRVRAERAHLDHRAGTQHISAQRALSDRPKQTRKCSRRKSIIKTTQSTYRRR